MKPNKHIEVTNQEWKIIINALDSLEFLVTDQPINEDVLDSLKFFFKPDKISELSERLCKVK